ncbi:nuclear transport factor 2 family protein [uncultured Psychroserpens sp.]|uniref:nuclear transport factor 2 family protein n=1 Tax=uncultured Psychroserpens sp. TaxID=255436 RepID=UPI002636F580|nr:nuclear transport factor 2 family protein [uncultured Psychroserpens sp.]
MKNIYILLLTLICLPVSSQSKNNDLDLIKICIQNYFDGYIERDIVKLNNAFDTENGTMKVPVNINGKITAYENKYFKDLMPQWGSRDKLPEAVLNNCALHILNIDIDNSKIATAKISMKVDDITYIDILSLQKINDNWKITNKMYYVSTN